MNDTIFLHLNWHSLIFSSSIASYHRRSRSRKSPSYIFFNSDIRYDYLLLMNARYFSNYFVDLLMCLLWMLSSWRNKWSSKYVTDGYSHLVDSFSILWRDSYFYTSCNERSVDNYSSFDILPTYYSFACHLMMTCVIIYFCFTNVKSKSNFFYNYWMENWIVLMIFLSDKVKKNHIW